MTKEIHKRLNRIEANLGHLELSEPNEQSLRMVRAKDPSLARKLRIALFDARGDFRDALQHFEIAELEALVAILAPGMTREPVLSE